MSQPQKGEIMVQRVGSKGLAALVLALVLGLPGVAQGVDFDLSKLDYEAGLDFAYGKNTRKATVRLFSFLPHWGLFMVRPGQEWGPFGISFLVEGTASIADATTTGFEMGITPLFKLSVLLFPGVMAHIEGGAGIISESINTPALAHVFNFTPQAGAGFDIALTPQLALQVAYRFRHSSNAGISEPNPSFNVNFFLAGLNYYY
jgi:opacity protein-like surface antigen